MDSYEFRPSSYASKTQPQLIDISHKLEYCIPNNLEVIHSELSTLDQHKDNSVGSAKSLSISTFRDPDTGLFCYSIVSGLDPLGLRGCA